MYTLYKHTNTMTEKAYIGYTFCTMKERWQQHLKLARMGGQRKHKNTIKLWNAIRKYGENVWNHEVLSVVDTEEQAIIEEIRLIQELDTFRSGYNTTKGGDGFRGNHDQATKQKIAEAAKCNAAKMRECGTRRQRNPHTLETKEKMRQAAYRRVIHANNL